MLLTFADDWKKGAYGVISGILKEHLTQTVVNVVGGGDQEWVLVELEANGVCKNGVYSSLCYTTGAASSSLCPTPAR